MLIQQFDSANLVKSPLQELLSVLSHFNAQLVAAEVIIGIDRCAQHAVFFGKPVVIQKHHTQKLRRPTNLYTS